MLEFLGHEKEGKAVEEAVKVALTNGNTTRDLGGKLGTKEVGDYICEALSGIDVC